MFYSETLQSPINRSNVMRLFGVDPLNDLSSAYRLNIFPVEEQAAGYGVSHYVKEGGSYRAIALPYTIDETQTLEYIRHFNLKKAEIEAAFNTP